MIVDECRLDYAGLTVYRSDDLTNWQKNNVILNTKGRRTDDADQGRHADVFIVDERAFIIYFTHPDRIYDDKNVEVGQDTFEYRRSSLQVAELELISGKVVCNRDKYLK